MVVLFEDVRHREVKRVTSTNAKALMLCRVAYEEFVVSAWLIKFRYFSYFIRIFCVVILRVCLMFP